MDSLPRTRLSSSVCCNLCIGHIFVKCWEANSHFYNLESSAKGYMHITRQCDECTRDIQPADRTSTPLTSHAPEPWEVQQQQHQPTDHIPCIYIIPNVCGERECFIHIKLNQQDGCLVGLTHCFCLVVQPPAAQALNEIWQGFALHHQLRRQHVITHLQQHGQVQLCHMYHFAYAVRYGVYGL